MRWRLWRCCTSVVSLIFALKTDSLSCRSMCSVGRYAQFHIVIQLVCWWFSFMEFGMNSYSSLFCVICYAFHFCVASLLTIDFYDCAFCLRLEGYIKWISAEKVKLYFILFFFEGLNIERYRNITSTMMSYRYETLKAFYVLSRSGLIVIWFIDVGFFMCGVCESSSCLSTICRCSQKKS